MGDWRNAHAAQEERAAGALTLLPRRAVADLREAGLLRPGVLDALGDDGLDGARQLLEDVLGAHRLRPTEAQARASTRAGPSLQSRSMPSK